jgi:hypothetical protein
MSRCPMMTGGLHRTTRGAGSPTPPHTQHPRRPGKATGPRALGAWSTGLGSW